MEIFKKTQTIAWLMMIAIVILIVGFWGTRKAEYDQLDSTGKVVGSLKPKVAPKTT